MGQLVTPWSNHFIVYLWVMQPLVHASCDGYSYHAIEYSCYPIRASAHITPSVNVQSFPIVMTSMVRGCIQPRE